MVKETRNVDVLVADYVYLAILTPVLLHHMLIGSSIVISHLDVFQGPWNS
jgi:hypothetical protein